MRNFESLIVQFISLLLIYDLNMLASLPTPENFGVLNVRKGRFKLEDIRIFFTIKTHYYIN